MAAFVNSEAITFERIGMQAQISGSSTMIRLGSSASGCKRSVIKHIGAQRAVRKLVGAKHLIRLSLPPVEHDVLLIRAGRLQSRNRRRMARIKPDRLDDSVIGATALILSLQAVQKGRQISRIRQQRMIIADITELLDPSGWRRILKVVDTTVLSKCRKTLATGPP